MSGAQLGQGAIQWRPDPADMEQAEITRFIRAHGCADYDELLARSNAEPGWFWDAVIRHFGIQFSTPYREILNTDKGPEWAEWCVGGKTNLARNCLERSYGADGDAVVWESELGATRRWSRADLRAETARLAHGLRALGLGPGSPIGLYMPMLPETVAAFLAVAAIGGIVLPLFSGFGPDAASVRLNDAGAVALITVDGTSRRGKPAEMKSTADEIAARVPTLRHMIVLENTRQPVAMTAGRDVTWAQATQAMSAQPVYEEMDAEAPFMVVFTSGTTGKAKGTVHSHCGFMTKLACDFGLSLDFRVGDRMMWMSDMGWVVGPMMVVVTTLLGGTMVLAEGTPDWPGPDRLWDLCARHKVSYFGLAPTIARALMKHGDGPVLAHDLSALRRVVSSGEPWNPDSWQWFFDTVCQRRVPILNVSGGTEIGWGIVTGTPLHPLKPCCFAGSCLGMGADIVDDAGHSVPPGQVGELVLRVPSIGLTRGLWKDPEKYLETYWQRMPGFWVHGDWASRDEDGMWYIHGRSDDTIKLAGKRTGPAEIESVVMATGLVTEVAACGIHDPVKGQAVALVCVAPDGGQPGPALADSLAKAVTDAMGHPFKPSRCLFVDQLPKTRSQKVMRRVVRAVLEGKDPGDLASLVNPEAVDGLRQRL